MSVERREQLVENLVEAQPELRAFLRDVPREHDLVAWTWDGLSYSFQLGFEALWDQACADNRGLLLHPLLSLWRQSVELALKAALMELGGTLDGNPGHDLDGLFRHLLKRLAELGLSDDDELTDRVRGMIATAQFLDPFADRFRYPSSKDGRLFEGIHADLDGLFQAHWIIVSYCEGAVVEVQEGRKLDASILEP